MHTDSGSLDGVMERLSAAAWKCESNHNSDKVIIVYSVAK